MSMKPMPKGMPASMGTANGVEERAEKPSQKREMTNKGPPRQARGRRRYSSRLVHAAPRATARRRMSSQYQKMGMVMHAPPKMGRYASPVTPGDSP